MSSGADNVLHLDILVVSPPLTSAHIGLANPDHDKTISCLLIQPNPDSALNSTAGHLLQDDYESFARHARLMTSINAKIPANLKEAARIAKERGNESGSCVKTDGGQPAIAVGESEVPSNAVLALSPPGTARAAQASDCIPRMFGIMYPVVKGHEASESKENDASLSQNPMASHSSRDLSQIKRPLSELSRSTQYGEEIARPMGCLVQRSSHLGAESTQGPEITPADSGSSERIHLGPQMCKGVDDGIKDHQTPLGDDPRATESGPPAKRVCSHEGKAFPVQSKSCGVAERPLPFKTTSLGIMPTDVRNILPRKSSAPAAVMGPSKGGRPRLGLKRL